MIDPRIFYHGPGDGPTVPYGWYYTMPNRPGWDVRGLWGSREKAQRFLE